MQSYILQLVRNFQTYYRCFICGVLCLCHYQQIKFQTRWANARVKLHSQVHLDFLVKISNHICGQKKEVQNIIRPKIFWVQEKILAIMILVP